LNNTLARIRDTISHSVADGFKENSMSFIFLKEVHPESKCHVKGHDIPHPGVTKIPHPISQD
jgi:hypothetical protein